MVKLPLKLIFDELIELIISFLEGNTFYTQPGMGCLDSWNRTLLAIARLHQRLCRRCFEHVVPLCLERLQTYGNEEVRVN